MFLANEDVNQWNGVAEVGLLETLALYLLTVYSLRKYTRKLFSLLANRVLYFALLIIHKMIIRINANVFLEATIEKNTSLGLHDWMISEN